MTRIWATAFLGCIGLAACSSTGKNVIIKSQLVTVQQNKYPEIVATFVERCVTATGERGASDAIRFYVITEINGSCGMKVKTHFNDDTLIANLLTPRLKRVDSRFTRLPNGLLGATWKFGKDPSWSRNDGTPIISLGRRSSKDLLIIRRFGPSL